MKKRIIAVCLTIYLLILGACSSISTSNLQRQTRIDEDGHTVYEEDSGNRTVSFGDYPVSMEYNEKHIRLTNVGICEKTYGYEYVPIVIVTLDISELDDAETSWLSKEDLDCRVYMDEGENSIDFSSMSFLGGIHWTDVQEVDLVFYDNNHYRHSFAGTEFSIILQTTQEEKYEYKSSSGETTKNNKVNEIACYINAPEVLENADDYIEEPLATDVAEWLGEEIPTTNSAKATPSSEQLGDYTYAKSFFSYSGKGDDIVSGLVVDDYSYLKVTHTGAGYFSVKAHYNNSYDLLVSTTDPYNGGCTLLLPDREYTLEVNGSGEWKVEAFRIGTASKDTFKGAGDIVTPIFIASSDAYEIIANGKGYFSVKGYYGNGRYDLLVSTTDPYSGKVMFKHKGDYCFFAVEGEREFTIKPQ